MWGWFCPFTFMGFWEIGVTLLSLSGKRLYPLSCLTGLLEEFLDVTGCTASRHGEPGKGRIELPWPGAEGG